LALIKKIFLKKIKSNAAKFVKLDLTPNLSSNGMHVGLYFLKNINRVNNMQSTSTIYIYIYIYKKRCLGSSRIWSLWWLEKQGTEVF
jgi:hypothetical protein